MTEEVKVKNQRLTIMVMLLIGATFLFPDFSIGNPGKRVSYPEGYRQWTHVKSMVIEKGHPLYDSFGGIHHVYANRRALEALTTGTPFPDGSVLVFDLLEAKSADNSIVEGQRRFIGVMQKNAKMFRETAGWGFEAFTADSRERIVKDPKNECFTCHEAQKKSDYVFSAYRK